MSKTIFLDKSYIAASILSFKHKYLGKDFITFAELNYISNQIQKKLREQELDATILNNIDTNYFEISNVINANESNNISLENIITRYQGYIDLNLLFLIWNEEIIFDYLSEFMLVEMDRMKKSFKKGKILKKCQ